MTVTDGRHRREKGVSPTLVLHTIMLDRSDSPGAPGKWQTKARELIAALQRSTSKGADVVVTEPYFRRHCYDKPHRCPGWAGGGRKYTKPGKTWCNDGWLEMTWREERSWSNDPWLIWRWHRCNVCGVRALPIVVKYFDLVWWWKWKLDLRRNLQYLSSDIADLYKDRDWKWFWRNRTAHIRFWPANIRRWYKRLDRWRRKDYSHDEA